MHLIERDTRIMYGFQLGRVSDFLLEVSEELELRFLS